MIAYFSAMRRLFILAQLFWQRCAAICLITVMAGTLASCVYDTTRRGYSSVEPKLDAVEIGMARPQLLALLGTPSIQGLYDNKRLIYLSETVDNRIILKPRITSRRIIALQLDANDRLSAIERYDLDDQIALTLNETETPTRSKTATFWDELFGNLGRFSNFGNRNNQSSRP